MNRKDFERVTANIQATMANAQQLFDFGWEAAANEFNQGNPKESKRILSDCASQLRSLRQDIDDIRREVREGAIQARTQASNSGKAFTSLLGRGKFGNSVRGTAARFRENERADVSHIESMLRQKTQEAKRFIEDLIKRLDAARRQI